jgi:hypothetical protein
VPGRPGRPPVVSASKTRPQWSLTIRSSLARKLDVTPDLNVWPGFFNAWPDFYGQWGQQ